VAGGAGGFGENVFNLVFDPAAYGVFVQQKRQPAELPVRAGPFLHALRSIAAAKLGLEPLDEPRVMLPLQQVER
jgi:hypothetical protein